MPDPIDREAALTAVDMDTSMVLPGGSKPGSVAWRMREAALNAIRALPAIGSRRGQGTMTLRERFIYAHQRLWERVESAARGLSDRLWDVERRAIRGACDWNRLLQEERGWVWSSTGQDDALTAATFEETRQRMMHPYGREHL